MAFATRGLRLLYKKYNGNCNISYSTLRKPSTKLNIISATQKFCFYSTENSTVSPKITGTLTNIRSSASPISAFSRNLDEKDESSQSDESKKEEEEDRKQREKSKKMMKWSFIALGSTILFSGSLFIYDLMKPVYDENGNLMEDEFSNLPIHQKLWKRICREFNWYQKFVQEPSFEKLLPDPMKYPFQPPYTLVLELKDLLIHPDWTYQTGWRFKKRPGVDQFLAAVGPPHFEIVIYTAEPGMTVTPIIESLDTQGYIFFKLYRCATKFLNGHHVKALDSLNRDLSKVIVVDWEPENVQLNPQNLFKIPRWTGNDDDTTLYDLAAFLKTIYATNVDDVRDVLTYYQQFENPIEAFKENQQKLFLQMQEDELQKQQIQNSKALTSRWSSSFIKPK